MGPVATLVLLLAQAAPTAPAAPAAAPTSVFVREALRICVDTAAQPAKLRELAAREKWTAATPASVPTHAGVATGSGKVSPAALWKGEIDGLAFTITLYDTPGGLLFSSRCEIGAWGLDLDAAHAAFTAQEGFEDKSQAGWPIKQYAVKKPPLSVVYAAGERDGGVLHTFTAER